MRRLLTRLTLAGWIGGALVALPAVGQESQVPPVPPVPQIPQVVSKVVALGPGEARLTVELTDGRALELALSDGVVRMGDQQLGRYSEGGALEESWRALVARAAALDDDRLLQALVDWTPPEGLSGQADDVAARIDEFLTLSFDAEAIEEVSRAATAEAMAIQESLEEGLRGLEGLSLLSRLDVLTEYAEAVADMDTDNLRVVIDDYLEIGAGQDYRGSILLIDGSMEIRGTVRGDVTVIDGDVELRPGSEIRGTVRLADASLDNDGGQVRGGVLELDRGQSRLEMEIREEILREIRNEVGADYRDRGSSFGHSIRRVFSTAGDLVGRLFTVLILGLVGAAFFHFGGPNMDAVAEVARNSTGRAAIVGMAGGALALPVFVLGIVGLAVTIIGIPAILLWVPLFPAAVILACLVGYLAVARNVGAWLSKQRYPYTDWVRITNPVTLVFGGLFVLAAPFFAADVVSAIPFLGVFAILLGITGFMMSAFAGAVGLGAVLLTRGGRKPEEWGTEMFTRPWRERRWGRSRDPEAEAFDAELARDEEAGSGEEHAGHGHEDAEWEEVEPEAERHESHDEDHGAEDDDEKRDA